MTSSKSILLQYAASTLLIALALVAVGFVPTMRNAGGQGVSAMLAGCAVSLIGSWAGAIPLVFSGGGGAAHGANLALASMAVRIFIVAILATAVALTREFALAPLLIWVGISYMGFLIADTWFTVRITREAVGGLRKQS